MDPIIIEGYGWIMTIIVSYVMSPDQSSWMLLASRQLSTEQVPAAIPFYEEPAAVPRMSLHGNVLGNATIASWTPERVLSLWWSISLEGVFSLEDECSFLWDTLVQPIQANSKAIVAALCVAGVLYFAWRMSARMLEYALWMLKSACIVCVVSIFAILIFAILILAMWWQVVPLVAGEVTMPSPEGVARIVSSRVIAYLGAA